MEGKRNLKCVLIEAEVQLMKHSGLLLCRQQKSNIDQLSNEN